MSGRREQNRTDESESSAFSVSLEAAGKRAFDLEQALTAKLAVENNKQSQLSRMLSFKSTITTASSTAEKQNLADPDTYTFRLIGTGSVGKLFEHPGTNKCYKLPIRDSPESKDMLWMNYVAQLDVQGAFDRIIARVPSAKIQVQIPRALWYGNKDTADFWDENIDRFEWDDRFPKRACNVLCMERIFPIPKPARELLIEAFVKKDQQEAAKSSHSNKDCLIRPFLGREKRGKGNLTHSLRNFIIHVDAFEHYGFPADLYAGAMAQALAILHWEAHLDGYDVEFVLGTSPSFLEEQVVRRPLAARDVRDLSVGTSTFERVTNAKGDFKHRMTDMWLIDFDACKRFDGNSAGVQQAVRAFVETDPYYPRPHSGKKYQEDLWNTFVKEYLTVSTGIIPPQFRHLAQEFIDGVSAAIKKRREEDQPETPTHSRSGSTSTENQSPTTKIWNGGALSPSPRRQQARPSFASAGSLRNPLSGAPSFPLPSRPRGSDRSSDDPFGGPSTGGSGNRGGRGGGGRGGRGGRGGGINSDSWR